MVIFKVAKYILDLAFPSTPENIILISVITHTSTKTAARFFFLFFIFSPYCSSGGWTLRLIHSKSNFSDHHDRLSLIIPVWSHRRLTATVNNMMRVQLKLGEAQNYANRVGIQPQQQPITCRSGFHYSSDQS